MKVHKFLQKHSIFVAIGFTAFLIGVSSLLTFYGKYQAQQFDDVKERIERVDELMNYVQTHRNNITKGTKAFLLVPDDKFLKPYEAAGKQFADHFDTLQILLETQGFTKQEELTEARVSIKEYYELMGEIISLKRQGSDSTALAIYQTDPGYPVWKVCYEFANQVQAFENDLYTEARNRYQYHLYLTTVMQALLFLIGVPTLIFVIRQIKKSNNLRHQLFTNLLKSRKTYLVDDQSDDGQQSEQEAVESIIEDLKTASKFINRIADGDYSVTWEDVKSDKQIANQDNLAEALANMREQMKAVKQKDQQQLWMTEGEGKVAEIARTHQTDLTALGDQLLSYIIPYLHANQGGLFIVNEADSSEPYLEMVACYAYDKKKHEEKQIQLGQGLVGQAFVEQKTIRLNQLPDNYVQITSGLGEATPAYLAIVPLRFNEEVLGVLEIASFQALSDFEVRFLEKVGEIIASSVSIVRTNERTQHLLHQSREQTEEMQAQEEEMRQNLEELLATQEAASRSQQKVQAIFDSATDGIVMITAQGQVEMFNPAAEAMFGYTADEILNQSFENLFVPPSNDQEGDQLEVALAVGQLQTIEAKRKDGEVFQAELRLQESQVGSQKMLIGLIRDLTQDERQKANEKLMRERIQEIEAKAYDRLVKLREKFKGQLAERDQQIETLKANPSS